MRAHVVFSLHYIYVAKVLSIRSVTENICLVPFFHTYGPTWGEVYELAKKLNIPKNLLIPSERDGSKSKL